MTCLNIPPICYWETRVLHASFWSCHYCVAFCWTDKLKHAFEEQPPDHPNLDEQLREMGIWRPMSQATGAWKFNIIVWLLYTIIVKQKWSRKMVRHFCFCLKYTTLYIYDYLWIFQCVWLRTCCSKKQVPDVFVVVYHGRYRCMIWRQRHLHNLHTSCHKNKGYQKILKT